MFPSFSFLTFHLILLLLLLHLSLTAAHPLDHAPQAQTTTCTFAKKRAAVAQEIKTIASHSPLDAAQIPLAQLASRTFYITPDEFNGRVTLPSVNAGLTADTVRVELVALATALDSGVPAQSVRYTDNRNGSVTVDYVQVGFFG
ncbi:MAG: hypothetical protein Q9182_001825 [Xanthomendoza sp. 2 TL-2023]